MRIISLSVDGIFQASHRGLYDWLASQDADVICLQDLRAQEPEVADREEFSLDGYFAYFFDSPKPHTNGVAIYTRRAPKAIVFGFGLPCGTDMDGRYLQADFDNISVGSLLAPPALVGEDSQRQKDQFFQELQAHLEKVTRKKRRYIICGNWQIAHTDSDVKNAEAHLGESGFLPHERQWLDQLYRDVGYADAFRRGNTDEDEFSWWPAGVVGRGDGWRTDLQVVSKDLARTVEYAVMYKANAFSSHTPVIVDYDIEEL
ncbi:MAG: exodeoxyribonuclease III [Porticoccaceae bacterium]|jgi:exodeoxyribonuclease-3|nr:exodeoxyribonuclease III [Porticoccaceae bacterium]HLS97496.1 exodeoxyribonuclease III [Porticoccaceae bacterium]